MFIECIAAPRDALGTQQGQEEVRSILHVILLRLLSGENWPVSRLFAPSMSLLTMLPLLQPWGCLKSNTAHTLTSPHPVFPLVQSQNFSLPPHLSSLPSGICQHHRHPLWMPASSFSLISTPTTPRSHHCHLCCHNVGVTWVIHLFGPRVPPLCSQVTMNQALTPLSIKTLCPASCHSLDHLLPAQLQPWGSALHPQLPAPNTFWNCSTQISLGWLLLSLRFSSNSISSAGSVLGTQVKVARTPSTSALISCWHALIPVKDPWASMWAPWDHGVPPLVPCLTCMPWTTLTSREGPSTSFVWMNKWMHSNHFLLNEMWHGAFVELLLNHMSGLRRYQSTTNSASILPSDVFTQRAPIGSITFMCTKRVLDLKQTVWLSLKLIITSFVLENLQLVFNWIEEVFLTNGPISW